jgi:hypothetical protein
MGLDFVFFNRFLFDNTRFSSGCRSCAERGCQNRSDRQIRIAPAMPMTAARKRAHPNCMITPESLYDKAIGAYATRSMLQFDR